MITDRPKITNDCFFIWLRHFLDRTGPVLSVEQAFDIRVVADMARSGAQWKERIGSTRIVEVSLLAELLISGSDRVELTKRIVASQANVRLGFEIDDKAETLALACVVAQQHKVVDPHGHRCSRRFLIYEVAQFLLVTAGWELETEWSVPRADLLANGPAAQTWGRPDARVNIPWRSTLPEALEVVSWALSQGMP